MYLRFYLLLLKVNDEKFCEMQCPADGCSTDALSAGTDPRSRGANNHLSCYNWYRLLYATRLTKRFCSYAFQKGLRALQCLFWNWCCFVDSQWVYKSTRAFRVSSDGSNSVVRSCATFFPIPKFSLEKGIPPRQCRVLHFGFHIFTSFGHKA